MKLPPFGKTITARIAHGNPPDFIAVSFGVDAWQRAKYRNDGPSDTPAVVFPPGDSPRKYDWPVAGSFVIVEVDNGPSEKQIDELATELLRQGAATVSAWWPKGQHELTRYLRGGSSDAG